MYAAVRSTIGSCVNYYYQLTEPRYWCDATGNCTCELYLKHLQWYDQASYKSRIIPQNQLKAISVSAYIFPCNAPIINHDINETCEARDNCFLNIDSTGCIIETPTLIVKRRGNLYDLCTIPAIVPQIPTPEFPSYIIESMHIIDPHEIEEQNST